MDQTQTPPSPPSSSTAEPGAETSSIDPAAGIDASAGSDPEISESPFASAFQALGGQVSAWRGALSAEAFGDAEVEKKVLASSWGVLDGSAEQALAVSGEDRARFLEGQLTCHVGGVDEGSGTYGFFVTHKGRVESDLRLLALPDRLWLGLPPGQRQPMRARLEKYVIVDRVAFDDLSLHPLRVIGPQAAEALSGLVGDLPLEAWQHRRIQDFGSKAGEDTSSSGDLGPLLVREPSLHLPGSGGQGSVELSAFALWLTVEEIDGALEALIAAGAQPVGHRAYDAVRIAAGLPLFGLDFGVDCFPQETGLGEDAVSYTKGCYLGQEVVARIHYRGGVQRQMRGLVLPARSELADFVDASLWADGKKVGRIGSAGQIGDDRRGLAVVHLKAEAGSELEIRGLDDRALGLARLVDLPF